MAQLAPEHMAARVLWYLLSFNETTFTVRQL